MFAGFYSPHQFLDNARRPSKISQLIMLVLLIISIVAFAPEADACEERRAPVSCQKAQMATDPVLKERWESVCDHDLECSIRAAELRMLREQAAHAEAVDRAFDKLARSNPYSK